MGKIIGIDLGTTYSCVSVFDERKGQFVVVQSSDGTSTTPSVVGVGKGGEVLVGRQAKNRMAAEPDNTVTEIKRHMGEPMKDESGAPKLDKGNPIPYVVKFGGKEHTPQMISAYILRDLKACAEKHLGEPVTGAVITVPAYFEGGPRRATEEAGALAGLKVEMLLSEPTAAAIAFGMTTKKSDDEDDDDKPRKVLVYDLGGGTFDVSVIEITRGNIEVKGVGGDHYLGGVDFDRVIVDWALRKIQEDHGVDLRTTTGVDAATAKSFKSGYSRIYTEAEKLKIALSTQQSVPIALPFLFMHPGKGEMVNIEYELTRSEFLTMIAGKLKGTLATVDKVLSEVGVAKGDIDDVLLVGGSTRIPKVREMIEKHFGKAPRMDINPDECVAIGAAMQALKFLDTTALPPEKEQRIEEQLGKMGQVIDVTGHSLGVREGEDNMSVLIPKNSPIPATEEKIYQTAGEYQTMVKVRVHQGEDPTASRNTLLTEFDLVDLPPLPAGQVKIKIRFSLDVSGVLRVEATELVNNKQVKCDAKYGGAKEADPAGLLPTVGPRMPAPPPAATSGGAQIPASMRDGWQKANELLPTLQGEARGKLDRAMKEYLAALQQADAKAVDDKGNALMDVLFDVMP